MKKQLSSSGVEIIRAERRTPFNLKNTGVKLDPSKGYRWVDPKRIEERKNADGFVFSKKADGSASSDGTIRAKDMVLMERSRERDLESAKEKELRTMSKTRSVRQDHLSSQLEELSSRHGINLHKLVTNEEKGE